MSNRLSRSLSPYLRQHADNPVDWWEWSPEAFAEARRRNVPVLVSIGYATCHWCHVMAHESFEDPQTAALMNAAFVNIKVDREERPDVDSVYMDAVQAIHGRGGWPLHAFVDHEGRPFFAGMYFPRERWQAIVGHLGAAWHGDRAQVDQSARELTAHLRSLGERPKGEADLAELLTRFEAELTRRLDPLHPGLGGAPKFPPSQVMAFQLHRHPEADVDSVHILEAMQDSGLHDRVGGGFHRYATDRIWRVPHFEKMLYDQAQLLECFTLAAARTGRQDFWDTANDIADYLTRDLAVRDAQGRFLGFASAEDADDPAVPAGPVGSVGPVSSTGPVSPIAAAGHDRQSGREGGFYAWPPDQVRLALDVSESTERLVHDWDLHPGTPHLGPSGHPESVASHIPHPRAHDLEALARDRGMNAVDLRVSWRAHIPALRAFRDQRPRPLRDDKVLTDLNGLTLAGLATLARFEPRHRETLHRLANAMTGRITTHRVERLDGRDGYITDYGHLALGLVETFEVLGLPRHLDAARRVVELAVGRFAHEEGGFYSTPSDGEPLVRRSREDTDQAYPAGQHALALALVRLGQLTHDARLFELARGVFAVQRGLAERAPTACATLLRAMIEDGAQVVTVVVGGEGADASALADAARRHLRPGLHTLETRHFGPEHVKGLPLLEGRLGRDRAEAFVCVGTECLLPITTVERLDAALSTL